MYIANVDIRANDAAGCPMNEIVEEAAAPFKGIR
jgi:hypothetical protein